MTTHITQSPAWAKFRRSTPNVKKVTCFQGAQVYFHQIPFSPFTVAYIPRANIKISPSLKQLCLQEKALFIKVDPPLDFLLPKEAILSDAILPRHTIYIDLTQSEDELLKNMHEKTRYNLRLAQKRGVIVKEDENLEVFLNLLIQTEKRQNFYSHPPEYYRLLWQNLRPKKMVYLLTAYLHDNPIASIMLFKYKKTLFYPYGGSNPTYKEFQAPSLLHWEAIKLGKRLGCLNYDLWGTYKNSKDPSDPWFGLYRFKSGFGGKEVDFPPSFDIPLSPLYFFFKAANHFRWLFLKKVWTFIKPGRTPAT